MKRVVSVSLGSSSRDKQSEVELLGERYLLERMGTDGSMERAVEKIREIDGEVEAIGLGGIDLYLVAGERRWVIRDALKLANAAEKTPVVDGSGLKDTLERQTVQTLHDEGQLVPAGKAPADVRVLVVSAADRFGMAETFVSLGYHCTFGDLIYALRIPIPLRRLWLVELAATLACPILVRLPFRILYPTGGRQETSVRGGSKYFADADIIGGDFHYIRRYLPESGDLLAGKTIITNTTTEEDVDLLGSLKLHRLITTTPRIGGRSFGTNVMEALLVALSGRLPEELQRADYADLLVEIGWRPNVQVLNE
ncbi:MAG: quinate 5-dehydrogenase [Armatimonadota bacterium]